MRQIQVQTTRLLAAASVLLIGAAIAMWPTRASAQIPSTAAFACDFENNYCGFSEQSKVGAFLKENLAHAHVLIYGILVVIVMLFMPQGVIGFLRRIGRRMRRA